VLVDRAPLERLARPLLVRLVDRLDEIVQLGVLHGAETLYQLKEQAPVPGPWATCASCHSPAPARSAALCSACRSKTVPM